MKVITFHPLLQSEMSLPSNDTNHRKAHLLPFLRASLRAIEGGQWVQAEGLLDNILRKEPDFADALHLKGFIALQRGELAQARQLVERALAADLHADFHVERYHLTLGHILLAAGERTAAKQSFQAAMAVNPALADAHVGLAHVLMTEGELDAAITVLDAARESQSDPELNHLLGYGLLAKGDAKRAMICFTEALQATPDSLRYRLGFARCLRDLRPQQSDPALLDMTLRLLGTPGIDPRDLASVIESSICRHPTFAALAPLEMLSSEKIAAFMASTAFADPVHIPGFETWLNHGLIGSPEIERRLMALRRGLLHLAISSPATLQRFETLLSCMAVRAFRSEYIDPISDAERNMVLHLEASLADAQPSTSAAGLAVLALYQPLCRRTDAAHLAKTAWPTAYQNLKRIQLDEPLVEHALSASIPVLTPIDDASRHVQEMYEESPFPRWDQAIPGTPLPIAIRLRNALPFQTIPDHPSTNPDILVAGCGTGLHAILVATSYSNCRILAIDLSRTSLAYARRKSAELGINHLDFAQADILKLGSIERRFDVIESFGVLHHLRDPTAGLAQLAMLLKPDGYMMLGLYSELGRRDIVRARELIARHGYTDHLDDIRRFRQDLPNLNADLASRLAQFGAFHALSELRDLLFHRQEHRYTPQGLGILLDGAGLEFLGFEFSLPNAPALYRARFPGDPKAVDLDNWAQIEQDNPDLFAHCYRLWVRHKR